MKYFLITIFCFSFLLTACSKQESPAGNGMDGIAESYVKLVLKIGLYDADYVDAYYGPKEWKPSEKEKAAQFPYSALSGECDGLLTRLKNVNQAGFDKTDELRFAFLKKQLLAVKTRIDMLGGKKLSFNAESKGLYDAVAPQHSSEYFDDFLLALDRELPGKGSISERFEQYRNHFIIPQEKLPAVFDAAIKEARRRTLNYIDLPPNENFKVEYVTGKSWGAYNWYKGNNYSVIQVNTDLPVYVDRPVELACHEGYPGHHVYNVLLESHLVRDKKWAEFTVYPLFSPQSLIAEGTANYGIELAFPREERIAFEKKVIFPLAGLDPARAEKYYRIIFLTRKLDYAENEAARGYLDGNMSREEAIAWLMKYSLSTRERAEKSLSFFEQYRSYIINYNLGQDIIQNYMDNHVDAEGNPSKSWQLFYNILSTPQTPSGLQGF
ncbi:MAG: hypothetical protein P8184_09445 [Calditrichia bacterium]